MGVLSEAGRGLVSDESWRTEPEVLVLQPCDHQGSPLTAYTHLRFFFCLLRVEEKNWDKWNTNLSKINEDPGCCDGILQSDSETSPRRTNRGRGASISCLSVLTAEWGAVICKRFHFSPQGGAWEGCSRTAVGGGTRPSPQRWDACIMSERKVFQHGCSAGRRQSTYEQSSVYQIHPEEKHEDKTVISVHLVDITVLNRLSVASNPSATPKFRFNPFYPNELFLHGSCMHVLRQGSEMCAGSNTDHKRCWSCSPAACPLSKSHFHHSQTS